MEQELPQDCQEEPLDHAFSNARGHMVGLHSRFRRQWFLRNSTEFKREHVIYQAVRQLSGSGALCQRAAFGEAEKPDTGTYALPEGDD